MLTFSPKHTSLPLQEQRKQRAPYTFHPLRAYRFLFCCFSSAILSPHADSPTKHFPHTTPLFTEQCTQQPKDSGKISGFIEKLFDIVNREENQPYVGWSEEYHRQAFTIKAPVDFSTIVLPKYFKHTNFCSFVRQLNIYGFKKLEFGHGAVFMHKCFRADMPQLLPQIRRRKNGVKGQSKDASSQLLTSESPTATLSSPPVKKASSSSLLPMERHIVEQTAFIQAQNAASQEMITALYEVWTPLVIAYSFAHLRLTAASGTAPVV